MGNSFKSASLISAALILLLQPRMSDAAEIKVLSALGIKAVIDDLVPKFERASGHRLAVTFASGSGHETSAKQKENS
jgi:ABC-type molybdate transport system substrate-binding protein